MIEVRFPVPPPFWESLRSSLKHTLRRLRTEAVIRPVFPDHDPDLIAAWRSSLLDGQAEDLEVLLRILQADCPPDGVWRVTEEQADALLRACTVVRLHLRTGYLSEFTDSVMESGEIDPSLLTNRKRQVWFIFVFFASLQEAVIQAMDPDRGG